MLSRQTPVPCSRLPNLRERLGTPTIARHQIGVDIQIKSTTRSRDPHRAADASRLLPRRAPLLVREDGQSVKADVLLTLEAARLCHTSSTSLRRTLSRAATILSPFAPFSIYHTIRRQLQVRGKQPLRSSRTLRIFPPTNSTTTLYLHARRGRPVPLASP